MDNCIFCRIAKGEIPCHRVYQDQNFLAFFDVNPWVKGHTLVIPKKHYRWVWDVESIADYFAVVAKIANHYKKVLKTEFVMSFIYGYNVPHAHIHLLPNARNEVAFYPKTKLALDVKETKKMLRKIRLS